MDAMQKSALTCHSSLSLSIAMKHEDFTLLCAELFKHVDNPIVELNDIPRARADTGGCGP
jgi:hypothetical protein